MKSLFCRQINGTTFRMLILMTVCLAIACLAEEPTLYAQDRITIQKPGSIGKTRERGEVIDIVGDQVQFRFQFGGAVKRYDLNTIIKIETYRSLEYQNAIKQMQMHKYKEAAKNLQSAIPDEPRTWMKRDMLSLLVECHTNLGDHSQACLYFLALTQSDPKTLHFGRIPLMWKFPTADKMTASEMKEKFFKQVIPVGVAKEWMSRKSEVAQLLGASHLLFSSDFAKQAEEKLQSLSTKSDLFIREYAQLQRVRLKLAKAGSLDRVSWKFRKKQVQQLPTLMRGGPDYLLGMAAAQQGNSQQAVESFLWVPVVFKKNRPLAARCLKEAAIASAQMGQYDEVITFCGELIKDYPETDEAIFAKKELAKLSSAVQRAKQN